MSRRSRSWLYRRPRHRAAAPRTSPVSVRSRRAPPWSETHRARRLVLRLGHSSPPECPRVSRWFSVRPTNAMPPLGWLAEQLLGEATDALDWAWLSLDTALDELDSFEVLGTRRVDRRGDRAAPRFSRIWPAAATRRGRSSSTGHPSSRPHTGSLCAARPLPHRGRQTSAHTSRTSYCSAETRARRPTPAVRTLQYVCHLNLWPSLSRFAHCTVPMEAAERVCAADEEDGADRRVDGRRDRAHHVRCQQAGVVAYGRLDDPGVFHVHRLLRRPLCAAWGVVFFSPGE